MSQQNRNTHERQTSEAARGMLKAVREMPLIERKERLARLVRAAKCSRLLYAQDIEQHGKGFLAEICPCDLEAVGARRKLGIYKDDATGWLKLKKPTYAQAQGRHEVLTRVR